MNDPVVILSLALHLAVVAILVGYVVRALVRALSRDCPGCAGWEAASRTAWAATERERALHDEARAARETAEGQARDLAERVGLQSAALAALAAKPDP